MVYFDTSYAMPRCEYRYYGTLLPCNQFQGHRSHRGGGRGPLTTP